VPIIIYSYFTKLILIYFNDCALYFAHCAIIVVDGAYSFANKKIRVAHCAPYIVLPTCNIAHCAQYIALCTWNIAHVTSISAHSASTIAQCTNSNKIGANRYAQLQLFQSLKLWKSLQADNLARDFQRTSRDC
jgi:hypothetical protein